MIKITLTMAWPIALLALILGALVSACGQNTSTSGTSSSPPLELKKFAIIDQPGATLRISVAQDQSQADAGSIYSAISSNGEIVAFDSSANNLDGLGSGGHFQIFAKNRRDDTVHRVSVAIDGSIADGASTQPDISDDGVYVAFVSEASNLVANDNNQVADIFVRDLLRQVTTRVSVASDGSEANAASAAVSISADGRYVVFQSKATLSVDDNNGFEDIYIHDMQSGETRLLSAFAGQAGNGNSVQPKISATGNSVVFSSDATNLVSNNDNNAASDVFRVNTGSGEIDLISVNINGVTANGASDSASLNADGSVVAFRSIAGDLESDAAPMSRYQIFSRDTNNNTVQMISVSNAGEPANNTVFSGTVMSDNGLFVAYYTVADNLHINDNNGVWDVYARDLANHNTQLISVNSDGQAGLGSSFVPAINSDGHFISFGSSATNLVAGDSNDQWDVFLHILQAHNFPPVALAGDDVTVFVGSTVTLSGEQSYDPDASVNGVGPVKAFRWTLLDKPASSNVSLGNATSATLDVVPDVVGDYVFELVVNDGVQDSVADLVTVTAKNNLPPVPHIQIDTSSGVAPLTVNVSAAQSSDPDGDSLTYSWNFGDANADTANPNTSNQIDASHVYTQAGDYSILLSVSDSAGNLAQTAVTVSVTNANHAPVINPSASAQTGSAPLLLQFFANASDADNDSLSFQWDFGDGSAPQTEENPQHVFQAAGNYTVTLTVSDGQTVVSGSLIIVVNGELNVEVHRAYLELDRSRPAHDKIALDLHVHQALNLRGDDLVTIRVDGVEVLSMTVLQLQMVSSNNWQSLNDSGNELFQRFMQCAQNAGFSLIKFWQSDNELKLRVKIHELDFSQQLSLNNGVDVELQIGSQSGLQNILMTEVPTHCRSLRKRLEDHDSCAKDGASNSKTRYVYGKHYTDSAWIP